jgi:tetratricopeptide (TPR) repeat protein
MADYVSKRAHRDLIRIREYLEQGNLSAASAAAEATTTRFPDLAGAWYWRAMVEQLRGLHTLTIECCERAIALDPERVAFFTVMARSQLARSDTHLAVASAMRAVALNPTEVTTLEVLAEVLQYGAAWDQALMLVERALAKAPTHAGLLLSKAHLLRTLDRTDEAAQAFEEAIAVRPSNGAAHLGLAQLGGIDADHNHLQRLDALADRLGDDDLDRCWIDYARYLEYEAIDDDAAAISALLRGAASRRRQFQFDTGSNTAIFMRIRQLLADWEPGTDSVHAPQGAENTPLPIFVFGMPRSGIGIAAAMLGQHPEVQGAGESREFATCVQRVMRLERSSFLDETIAAELDRVDWNAVGDLYRARLRTRFGERGFVTERLPANYIFAAAIARALPEARLVRVVRDPMDNCFSLFRQMYVGVNPFSFDQTELAQHYIGYEEWMRHFGSKLPDRMLSLRYEQMVGAPVLVGRALFRFCGLDWHDDYASLSQPAAGAVRRMARVSGPLHTLAVGRWRRYAAALEPMFRSLSAAGLGPRPPG